MRHTGKQAGPEAVRAFARRRLAAFAQGAPYRYGKLAGDVEAVVASADAALVMHVIDEGSADPAWAKYLNSFQDARTGIYRDANSHWVEERRLDMWLFGMVYRALNAVGGKPAHPLRFLSEWADRATLQRWVAGGRDVMHLGIIWLRHLRYLPDWQAWRDRFFHLIESEPGDREGLPGRVCRDPFHTLFIYYAADREIPRVELLVDWFLGEQDERGMLFGGAPYSHMDGVHLLVEMSERTNYRREEIIDAVRRALDAILRRETFDELWDVDIHSLLARCETVAQAVRVLPEHPCAATEWGRAWGLNMWATDPAVVPEMPPPG